MTHISRNVMTHYFPSDLPSNLCQSMVTFGECKMCGNWAKQEIELLRSIHLPDTSYCTVTLILVMITIRAQSCKISWITRTQVVKSRNLIMSKNSFSIFFV